MGDQQTVNLFDFSGGIVNRRENPLAQPTNTLTDGENLNTCEKWAGTRLGYKEVSDAVIASGTVEVLEQVQFPTNEVTYLLAQGRSATECKLYASNTELPDDDITFTEIYDLGLTAGKISISTLNDRAIITEGVSKYPLVFLGGMTTDGSDWAVPKAIIGTMDGTNFYDMTNPLTDQDSGTYETLNAMPSTGAIYVCFDVKTIGGLYFEVKTANTTECELLVYRWTGTAWTAVTTTDNTMTASCTLAKSGTITWTDADTEYQAIQELAGFWYKLAFSITSGSTTVETSDIVYETDITQQNLRGTIRSWSQDSGATGRFRDGSGNAVVVNSSSGFWIGSEVSLADGTYPTIVAITGDGTSSGGIELSASKGTQNVTGIYNGVIVTSFYKCPMVDPSPTFIADGSTNTITDYCIPAMTNNTTPSPLVAEISTSSSEGYRLFDHSVSQAVGLLTGQWLQIDYGAGVGRVVNKYGIHLGATRTTSWTLKGTNDYVNWDTLHTVTTTSIPIVTWTYFSFSNSTAYRYYRITVDYIDQTSLFINELNFIFAQTQDNYKAVATLNSNRRGQLPSGGNVSSVTVTQNIAVSSQIYHCVSFDLQVTYKVFTSAAWRSIARDNSGTWQYNDSATATPNWVNSTVNTCQDAIGQAIYTTSANRMTKTAMEALTSSDWASTGGSNTHGTLDFACYITASIYGDVSYVDKYTVTATIPAGAISTQVSKLLYDAPCQQLQSIGSGVAGNVLSFLFYYSTTPSTSDYTIEVSDGSPLTYATLAATTNASYLYICGLTQFNYAKFELVNGANSTTTSSLVAYYWNGTTWAAISNFVDGTSVSSKTLNQSGIMSWSLPTDWVETNAMSTYYPKGYWIRLKFPGALTSNVKISEVSIPQLPTALKKHKLCNSANNRLVLLNRPEAHDQIDVSAEYQEYLWTGEDSYSQRVGALGTIIGSVSIGDYIWIAKYDGWFATKPLPGAEIVRLESAHQFPSCQGVMVPGPVIQYQPRNVMQVADNSNVQGVYFINDSGAWNLTATRCVTISQNVNWWQKDAPNPKIDINYLQGACGVYWPESNWVLWSVPMITGAGASQATNNRIIVFDVTTGSWLPPFTIAVNSLATAQSYNANTLGKLGSGILYGTDSSGKVISLFDDYTDDNGTDIASWFETGWLDFGGPGVEKKIRNIKVFGTSDATTATMKVYVDGEATSTNMEISGLYNSGSVDFLAYFRNMNIDGTSFKFRMEFTKPTKLYGIQCMVEGLRDWPTT